MVPACTNALKTDCGCLRAGKLKTAMYVFPPRHKENAVSKQTSKQFWPEREMKSPVLLTYLKGVDKVAARC